MLDKIGLTKKDGEGYRLRTDGKGRLRIELITVGGQFIPFTQIAEMIKQHWKKIGIDADVKETERSLAFTKTANARTPHSPGRSTGRKGSILFPRHALPVDPAEIPPRHAVRRGTPPTAPRARSRRSRDAPRHGAVPRRRGKKEDGTRKIAQEIWKIIVEEQWSIGTVGLSPAFMGVRIFKTTWATSPRAR